MRFEMALIQMSVMGGNKARNLGRAEEMIAEAAAHGSRLIVLPEVMDLGWTHPSSEAEAEPIPDGEPCRRLAQAAASHGVYVCAGLTERSGDRVFNSAVIIGKGGELLCVHRKLNELDIGHPYGDTWRDAYKPVAKEFSVWIAGVSNVGVIEAGPWAGRKCIGCSLVVGPSGEEVLQGPYGVDAETILYA